MKQKFMDNMNGFRIEEKIEKEIHERNLKCGYLGWTPDCLQKCNTPQCLLAALSGFMFIIGFVIKGIIYVNLATWERLYGLRSRESSWIVSSFDIFAALSNLVFGLLGRRFHNGKLISIGALSQAVGSLVMVSVHFVSQPYELGPLQADTCNMNENITAECDIHEVSHYYWLFIFGQFFHAIGGAVLFTIAIPYLDTQIKPKDTPIYIGILQAFAALGPAVGYIFGGLFLKIYVDIDKNIDSLAIDSTDPRWVGAWWIGLFISSVGSALVAVLVACFPRELPTAKIHREAHLMEMHGSEGAKSKKNKNEHLADSLKQIWSNPIWFFITLLGITENGMVIGFAAFIPKLIQHQFGKSPDMAAIYAGAVIIPGAVGGKVIGGLIPKFLNLKMKGLLMQSIIASGFGLLFSLQFLLRCDTPKIAGLTVPYFNRSSSDLDLQHSCNLDCHCSALSYDPICGSNGVEYFSPCYAGCLHEQDVDGEVKIYTDCSCLLDDTPNTSSSININAFQANSGPCESGCSLFYAFQFMFFLMLLATFISDTSSQSATIRSLTKSQKSLALGMQAAIHCVLGHAPKLYLLGYIFDKACLQWQATCDSDDGACWVYDSAFIAKAMFIVCMLVKTVSLCCYTLALVLYKPLQKGTGGVDGCGGVIESESSSLVNGDEFLSSDSS